MSTDTNKMEQPSEAASEAKSTTTEVSKRRVLHPETVLLTAGEAGKQIGVNGRTVARRADAGLIEIYCFARTGDARNSLLMLFTQEAVDAAKKGEEDRGGPSRLKARSSKRSSKRTAGVTSEPSSSADDA